MINGKVKDDVDLIGAPEAVQEKANVGNHLGTHPYGWGATLQAEHLLASQNAIPPTGCGRGSHCGTMLKSKTLEASQGSSSTQGGLFMETQEPLNCNEIHRTTTVSTLKNLRNTAGQRGKLQNTHSKIVLLVFTKSMN